MFGNAIQMNLMYEFNSYGSDNSSPPATYESFFPPSSCCQVPDTTHQPPPTEPNREPQLKQYYCGQQQRQQLQQQKDGGYSYLDQNLFDGCSLFEPRSDSCCATVNDDFLLSDDSVNESSGYFYHVDTFSDFTATLQQDEFKQIGGDHSMRSWKSVHPISWNTDDVLNFIYSLAHEGNLPLEEIRGEAFQNLNGLHLSNMSARDFEGRDPKYGVFIFEAYRSLVEEGTFIGLTQGDYPPFVPTVVASVCREDDIGHYPKYSLSENGVGSTAGINSRSSSESSSRLSVSAPPNVQRDHTQVKPVKRGRPPKLHQFPSNDDTDHPPCKKVPEGNKAKHLWEFICNLLKNSKGMGKDKIIQWENKELGVFRIVNSKEVALLWGQHKSSNKMTFEKLSRALRWCKTSGSMADLPDDGKYPKRLCFRFGPRAINWKTLAF